MMTRCRPVITTGEDVKFVMRELRSHIYSNYDGHELRGNIVTMRHKVESILGKVKNQYEIKRGTGGLMDIDFITHYFQLRFGNINHDLQTTSTRMAIREIHKANYITDAQEADLLNGYNFLKKVEMTLRLFDLKSADSFPMSKDDNLPLSRAMGYGENVAAFLDNYLKITTTIRQHFSELVGVPE
jgi:glutamate-ammonia-ligase adenylyltransferase